MTPLFRYAILVNVKTLGDSIRRQRKLRGLTQQDLGNKAGINQTSLSDMELGKAAIDVDELLRLADALGCSLKTLLGSRFDQVVNDDYEEVSRFSDDRFEYITYRKPRK